MRYYALGAIGATGAGMVIFAVFGIDTVNILADVPTYGALGIGLIVLAICWSIVAVSQDAQMAAYADVSKELKMEKLEHRVADLANENYTLKEKQKMLEAKK